jgi:hypothetical protein
MGRVRSPAASSRYAIILRMHDTSDTRLPRVAPILLIAAIACLAVVRPGILAGDSAVAYRFATTLISVAVVAYIAWRFHGIIAAAAAIVIFRIAEPHSPIDSAFLERQSDTVLLTTLAIGIGAASRQGKGGRWHWMIIAVAAIGVALFGWYGLASPDSADPIARERTQHIALGVGLLAFLLGLLAKSATWLDRLKLVGATIGIPAVGILVFRAVHGQTPLIFDGGDWRSIIVEWKAMLANGQFAEGSWAWAVPAVVEVLLVIGVWRTVARGLKEWKAGQPPIAWLVGATCIAAIFALGARPLASGSLALAAASAILCTFGVADVFLAIVERIELRPPEPGPSNVPRVK